MQRKIMVTDLDKKLFHLQTARCCIGRFRCHILHSHDTGTFHRTALKDELNANKSKRMHLNWRKSYAKQCHVSQWRTFALVNPVPGVSLFANTLTNAILQSTHTKGMTPFVHPKILKDSFSVSAYTLLGWCTVIGNNDCVQLKNTWRI